MTEWNIKSFTETQWPNYNETNRPNLPTDIAINPTPSSPWNAMNEDQLLMEWDKVKKAIEVAKANEMDLRKYIVNRAFPKKEEGTNRKELGQGYILKSVVKYNYTCDDNDKVENGLAKIAALGNDGPFIADRLISWTPNFKLTEYRQLQEDKEKGSKFAEEALKVISTFITIKDAAPTLEIVEPKKK